MSCTWLVRERFGAFYEMATCKLPFDGSSSGEMWCHSSSGRVGLWLLERHPIQLVILDYGMPDMNGEAVAREIRRTHPHVPSVVLSGQIDVPKRASSAVDAFVAKGQAPASVVGAIGCAGGGRAEEASSR